MIKIGKLHEIDKQYSSSDSKARMHGNAAIEYYRATLVLHNYEWRDDGVPFTYVIYPLMHQTIELLTKGVAYKIDPDFNPFAAKKNKESHSVNRILNKYSNQNKTFKLIADSESCTSLLAGLEASYLGLRYGENYIEDIGMAWPCYVEMANALFEELRRLTGLPLRNGLI